MASNEDSITTRFAQHVSTTVNHPRLDRLDSESIRRFLNLYDQYVDEVRARARQIGDGVSTEASNPVELKFCIDVDILKSTIDLGLIDNAETYDSLDENILRDFLEKESAESRATLTLSGLDNIVRKELKMDMTNKDASSRMKNLFIDYNTLLRRNGLSWLLDENEKVAINHVLHAIQPAKLRNRLESDIQFAHHELKKDFKRFFAHARKVSDAFVLVDSGSMNDVSTSPNTPKKQHSKPKAEKSGDRQKQPICLWEPHKVRGMRHKLMDCRSCPDAEKKALFEQLAKNRAKNGPAHNTRAQQKSRAGEKKEPTLGRLQTLEMIPSCTLCVSDGSTSIECSGRCDDGSDDSIASSSIAEAAVVKGVGKMSAISPVTIQVALQDGEAAQSFRFSRTWTVPRTTLKLSTGPMALKNISFLVSDAKLSCEDILIGLPILQHLRIDSRTLLELNREALDGADCSSIGNPTRTHEGAIGRLMIARMQGVEGDHYNDDQDGTKNQSQQKDDRPRVDYYECRNEPDPCPDPSLLDPLDLYQHDDILKSVENMLLRANNNGLPEEIQPKLRQLVDKHIDIFRVGFSRGPPANIPPLQIELSNDAVPKKVKLRNYSETQRTFLKNFTDTLVESKMAYRNPTALWASAPLLVPKHGLDEFRFTVDLRWVNLFTKLHHFPMPQLEIEMTKLSGSNRFANFDLTSCYWQLLLAISARESQSFITPDGVFTPTRVMHGSTNAVSHLQSALAERVPDELQHCWLHWLDDILLHDASDNQLLQDIESFFQLCVRLNLKLHPDKCTLFAKELRWCGRLISSEGWKFDPRNAQGLKDLQEPETGAELQQFICALQWMRTSIPNFAQLVLPLQDFLESVYKSAGKRTRRGVARIQLKKLGWSSIETNSFIDCKNALANQVILAHRDRDQRLCIYTDACDNTWSGIATQIPKEDTNIPHNEQHHTPLAFISGRFTWTQLRWSILEKEAYAVLATLQRIHWLAATTEGFDLYTDHNNLIFIFDPTSLLPDLSLSTIRKILRWAVLLSGYNYVCLHIKGEDNVWADILGRWAPKHTLRRLATIPVLPSALDQDFEWPTKDSIHQTQKDHSSSRPPIARCRNELWFIGNRLWIPTEATDLQLRLCIIAHTGAAGHRGLQVTENALNDLYTWPTLKADVSTFVRACVHCLSTLGGNRIPRPFGPSLHGTTPNALVQFDYIELGTGHNGEKYVLMVRDDHSNYCWLFPFPDTKAENAAQALLDWCAAFGVPQGLMSDGPTHFKNETVRILSKSLSTPHHFTLPYCPWSNGAVERLGRELLRIARAVLSETRMSPTHWPDILPLLQSALNNTKSRQRGGLAPLTCFTGLNPTPPIKTFLNTEGGAPVLVSDVAHERSVNTNLLISLMEDINPVVEKSLSAHRNRSRQAANKGKRANFTIGDFVLVAREHFHEGEKLCLRWRGPRRVINTISEWVYLVEDLRNGELTEVHSTRLKFYCDSSLDETAILPHVISSETGMQVQRLLRLVETNDCLKVVIRWRGLTPNDDTEEPLRNVYEDVPQLLTKLLSRQSTSKLLAKKARRELGLPEEAM